MIDTRACNKSYNESVASAYASYAKFISRYGAWSFFLGLLLAVVACIGLINVNTSNDVINIWMYKGTRMDGEKDFFEEHFGGDTRSQSVLLSAEDGSTVATAVGFDAMLEATQVFISGGEEEITYDLEMDGVTETFGVADLCVSPPVPTAMLPYSSDATLNPPGWLSQFALISYGYRQVSLCAKNGTGSLPVPEQDLEYGWGIDRLPCSRFTMLDCFQEGNYDYPEAMKQLDEVSSFVALNNPNVTAQCVAAYGVELQETLEVVGMSTDEATTIASETTTQLQSTILAFWTWGYHWRKSYMDMTDEEIFAHISEARAFASSGNSTVTDCIVPGGACCLSWAGTKLELEFLMAGFDEEAQSIEYIMTAHGNFPVNHPAWESRMEARGVDEENEREDISLGWETEYVDVMLPKFKEKTGSEYADGETFEEIRLDFFSERSGNDLVEEGNEEEGVESRFLQRTLVRLSPRGSLKSQQPEAYLIWIAYVGMLLFAAFSMGSWNIRAPKSMLLYSRVLLSLGGVVIIALSTLACLGFISAVGVDLTPLSIVVVPFLSLGIGIDDMFIFIYTMVIANGVPEDPAKRLEVSLIHAGPSVTITSISNAGCFLLAYAVPIPTVRNFAVHMGIQLLFHLVLFHLMLVPMMHWDAIRVKNRRADLMPLIKFTESGLIPEKEFINSSGSKQFVEKIYAPILQSKVFKALVLICAVAMTAVLTWIVIMPIFGFAGMAFCRHLLVVYGVTEYNLGVGLHLLAEDGSYEKSFLEVIDESFTADALSLVTKEVDMGTYQDTLLDVQDAVEDLKWVSTVSTVKDNSWLADSQSSFLGPEAVPKDADDFNVAFESWIKGSGITNANNFFCTNGTDGPRVDCTEFDASTTVIKASTQRVFVLDQSTSENVVDLIHDFRDAVDGADPDRDTFAYSDSFALQSQYLFTWQTFFWIIGGGAVMVAVVILLLQGSVMISLLITLTVALVILQVFGFLAVIDLGINGFTIVNMCVMVGLVVEFTAHIGRGFLFAEGQNRDERVKHALTELLWPTFAGFCTTFFAVLPLAFSKISFFHAYYFEMFAIMAALGFFAGVCLLPVMLSIVGPESMRLQKHSWDGAKTSTVLATAYEPGAK